MIQLFLHKINSLFGGINMMIPKPRKRTKTCKTLISGKSWISPFFQRQFGSLFLYKLTTEVDFFGGARGGEYISPIKMSKT